MNEEIKEPDLALWFSTYGMLTAERILEGFKIQLDHDELVSAIKNPRSIYFQLLRVPLKNIFNGIILQQIRDYQVYAQKIFIDYLMSGQADKPQEAPGASIREDMETERKNLVELGEAFSEKESAHLKLISESQASLIKLARELQKTLESAAQKISRIFQTQKIAKSHDAIQHAIRAATIHYDKEDHEIFSNTSLFWSIMEKDLNLTLNDELRQQSADVLNEFREARNQIDEVLEIYLELTNEMTKVLRDFRSKFYKQILRASELIQLLPDYRDDETRRAENLESLDFDAKIGEE
ncbi:hypothetical protein [Legionella oakridgensis]|uniref:Uncharacterized protein n=2 Tax=Legionella oakridgensis TaxID=29423 RepID=W0B979_9GAMM|nr:hypothetical protein [Legionella oakridgensis]AHE67103.1 hypothetical protein Loa_01554 [Legionella oakridgensis ATCC 33761 = DSM 21215]ETO93282.1 hypothetical protein LOR_71c20260 [Legionella oakridgensis RV-2-2007]KTD44438.1 hypothetical protein Loak_0138 [Legionella oakridgensis]STY20193.1 Uncharacterised protein [Legionella longbeachae]